MIPLRQTVRFGAASDGVAPTSSNRKAPPCVNSEVQLCIASSRGRWADVGPLVRAGGGGVLLVLLLELAQLAPARVLFDLEGSEVFAASGPQAEPINSAVAGT